MWFRTKRMPRSVQPKKGEKEKRVVSARNVDSERSGEGSSQDLRWSKDHILLWRSTQKHFVCRSPERNPSLVPWNMVLPTVFHLTSHHVSFFNSGTEKLDKVPLKKHEPELGRSSSVVKWTWTHTFVPWDKCTCEKLREQDPRGRKVLSRSVIKKAIHSKLRFVKNHVEVQNSEGKWIKVTAPRYFRVYITINHTSLESSESSRRCLFTGRLVGLWRSFHFYFSVFAPVWLEASVYLECSWKMDLNRVTVCVCALFVWDECRWSWDIQNYISRNTRKQRSTSRLVSSSCRKIYLNTRSNSWS